MWSYVCLCTKHYKNHLHMRGACMLIQEMLAQMPASIYIYTLGVCLCILCVCVCVRTCTHYLWINSCPQVSMSTRKKAYIFTIIYSHTPHTSTGWWLQPLKNAFLSPWRICSSVFIIPFDLKIEKYIKILESTQHTNHTISNHQDTSRRIKIH